MNATVPGNPRTTQPPEVYGPDFPHIALIEIHDLVLAVTSHAPHLIAYTMVGVADDLRQCIGHARAQCLALGGGRLAGNRTRARGDDALQGGLERIGRIQERLRADPPSEVITAASSKPAA